MDYDDASSRDENILFLERLSMQEWNSLSLESILSLSDRCLPRSRHAYFIRTHAMIT